MAGGTIKGVIVDNQTGDALPGANILVKGTSIGFNSTGDWDTWGEVSASASLNSGVQNIRLEATGSSGLSNIDYMEISGPGIAVENCGMAKLLGTDEIDTKLPELIIICMF